MNIRRAAPLLFVALCLGLSTLVLRRQIAAHPMPRSAASSVELPGQEEPDNPGQPVEPKTWHIATGSARRAALMTIGSQLAAIRAGDADGAWFYQSRGLHRNFPSAQDFVSSIKRGYPEFGDSKSASYGPVWMDPTGDHADVTVTVRGRNGRLARGYYQLVRENGNYRVASVAGGRAVNEAESQPAAAP